MKKIWKKKGEDLLMAQSFIYKETAVNQWIWTEENQEPEKLYARATIENIKEALKEHENVTVVSAQWEPVHDDWKEVFRVVLSEEGYGAHPATIQVFCPLDWNGRFLACTGGGIRTHHIYEILGRENRIVMPFNAVANGFAAANTDGGVPGDVFCFGLDEETKKIDYELILNLAYRSTHSMAVIAKKVIEAVYGEKPAYSYMQGASGGGRQTLTEAQLYPEDFDGFWAVDPAINWNEMIVSDTWGMLVMNQEEHVVAPGKMEVFRREAIRQNGGRYDFIETSEPLVFDPASCVGMESADGCITEEDARVMKLIFDGPETRDGHAIWYGFRPGTHFWSSGAIGEQGGGCNIRSLADGSYQPIMNSMFESIVDAWVMRDMQYDWSKVDYRGLEEFYKEAVRVTGCLECNNPDLYQAEQSGAKILLTHAVNDDTIPSDGTIDYYKRVVAYMGQESGVQKFLRLFMTPGGGHTDITSPGLNLTTSIGMTALMKWVEEGEAPELLDGVQYDFEQKAPLLTGKVSLYSLDNPGRCVEVAETSAYAKRDAYDAAQRKDELFMLKKEKTDRYYGKTEE
ncbi:tannase and feruloyl esterase [Marvinbryantia formatexigens DSM 14469]|uniref:Tannase and feruloyl esterase n=2 Tax=Marvinbryantia TaxID=248744 RepID=C6LM72_9FIRM|nr:tannase and feruloyl esterase [Marvinbryantia formatexigens DSM 14469]